MIIKRKFKYQKYKEKHKHHYYYCKTGDLELDGIILKIFLHYISVYHLTQLSAMCDSNRLCRIPSFIKQF